MCENVLCVCVCVCVYLHMSGNTSFILNLTKKLHQKPRTTKLAATTGPPTPGQKLYFGWDIRNPGV